MQCSVNGQPEPADAISCQEMGFNQLAVELPLLDYQISLAMPEVVERCGNIYNEHVGYEKGEDPYYRRGRDALIDRWRDLNYPALADLIRLDPEVLRYLIRWRMGHEMLQQLVPLVKGKLRYVLNTLDRIEISPQGITLGGKAWEA